MKYRNSGWTLALLITVSSLAAAPVFAAGGGKSLGKDSGVVPATVEDIPGSKLKRVTITERAAKRIDLKTQKVREATDGQARFKVVPYSSLIYDPHGGTWVYTVPAPRTFVRAPVDVSSVKGDDVYLTNGPAVGSEIASVGVAEIYGTEFEVGH